MEGAAVALLLVLGFTVPPVLTQSNGYLEWIALSNPEVLPESDDEITGPIMISTPGFPFWDSVQTQVYIGTNGLLSFGSGYNSWSNQDFPGSSAISSRYLVAPFWDDVDIRGDNGEISYQVFQSGDDMEMVSSFIRSQTSFTTFEGTWMMVVFWDSVHPYFGAANIEENTFQAVLITDGVNSFSVFTYNCGLIEWDNGGTIGFSAAGQMYANEVPSGSDLACINLNASVWSNVIYNLSMVPNIPIEPAQEYTLDFINITIPDGVMDSTTCTDPDCSEMIDFPTDFPFGEYSHSRAYINDNGVISMPMEFPTSHPSPFPTADPESYWLFSVAPFWSNGDIRIEGSIKWKFYVPSEIDFTPFNRVIMTDQNVFFSANWVLLVHWDSIHPFPHGDNADGVYNQKTNSFQAVLATDGTKSYAVFTYKCSSMNWAFQPTIGTNAGGTLYNNHPLTGYNYAFKIGCVHTGQPDDINNVVYDLVPNPDSVLPSSSVPPYHNTIGSCVAANYTTCCTSGNCLGEPQSCYCDNICRVLSDCCYDFIDICPLDLLSDDYLIVAERESLDHIAYNGSGFEQIRTLFSGDAVGIDFHFQKNYVFWSDVGSDIIYRASIDGTGDLYSLVDSYISAVDDIAVDWVANNVYWVDAVWSRIEVADLNGTYRAQLIPVGANSNPRAIAVDPQTRYMFWTDWGKDPKIERADMDGENRMTLISDGLLQPFGITVDYEELRIYWCDSGNNFIEHASLDGGGRTVLIQDTSGLDGVFSLTVASSVVFWTDTVTRAVYSAHKIDGNSITNHTVTYDNFQYTPYGIEAVSSSRQADVYNPCESSGCTQLCLLATNPSGFTCKDADETEPVTPDAGSCVNASYSECCTHGYCAGFPATCFCDDSCYDRGDCCLDVNLTCSEVPPRTPINVVISGITTTSATISWTIPEILYTEETYYVVYGLTNLTLDQTSESISSGSDVTVTDMVYTITLDNLHPYYTYYFVVTSENSIAPRSTEIYMFTTLEAAPSGPPENFTLTVTDNSVLVVSWDPPAYDMQNGVITRYTLSCTNSNGEPLDLTLSSPQTIYLGVFTPLSMYSCTISASTIVGPGPLATASVTVPELNGVQVYLPFIPLDLLEYSDIVQLPETDDGFSDGIPLAPSGVPFGDSNQTTAYVGTNGLLSFGSAYNSFFNQPFTSNDFRYLVAPFWDDVDITGGNGDIFYLTADSGLFLGQVNSFIRYVRPTEFESTWMLVAYWVGVHPYVGPFNPEENTFQAIVASDGISTYTIFTYKCGLMEWDNIATIGFSAAGNPFINHDPSSSDVACVNSPDSNWSNVVNLLSNNNPEIPPPGDIRITDITNTSATVSWTIRYISEEQQQYTLLYGSSEDSVNVTADVVSGSPDFTLTNQTYSLPITGLDQANTYYVQVVSEFGIYTLYSDIVEFTTTERAPTSPPRNFTGDAEGLGITFSWDPPAEELLLDSYNLSCMADNGSQPIVVQLNPVETFTLAELSPATTYTCTIAAATTGGDGPPSPPIDVLTSDFTVTDVYFPFIQLDTVYGASQVFAEESDDGTTGPIPIDLTFPFGDSAQSQFYVGTNGLLSFGSSFNSFANQQFPGNGFIADRYLVAPFWDDADTRGGSGQISYEIHTTGYYLHEVNEFLQRKRPSDFVGTWMAVVYYDSVHPFFGVFNPEENTYQVILVTDGQYSYTIFTYQCGLMEWDNGATIGYTAAGYPYENFDPSTSAVACLNFPDSNFTNVVFRLSDSNPELEIPLIVAIDPITRDSAAIVFDIPRTITQETYAVEYGNSSNNLDQVTPSLQSENGTFAYTITIDGLSEATIYYFRVSATYDVVYKRYSELSLFRTSEDEQVYYLPFLPHDDSSIISGTLEPCDDCTSDEIVLPDNIPIGGYLHETAFVSTNGIITFGRSFEESTPEDFPPTDADTFWRYIVAPFWADFNTTIYGSVSYELYTSNSSADILNQVNQLIQLEYGDDSFIGDWMLAGYWENVTSPFPINFTSTFQGIVITDGSQSYAVYTYRCGDLYWLDSATIGFNAPPSTYSTHPLSGLEQSSSIACVHAESPWNNVIFDLEPNPIVLGTTPEPRNSFGSCRAAGHDTCCIGFFCTGSPADCFCDTICTFFGDCCYDFPEICTDGSGGSGDMYDLLVANGQYIYTVHFEGNYNDVLRDNEDEQNTGIDVHFESSKIFWSDVASGLIYRANMDGSDAEVIVSDNVYIVEDLAVDWVSNKLYWVDAVLARVEVMDLETLERAVVLRTGANTSPRAIAVEPLNRFMFWTDWGLNAKIERSFMDGGDRRTLINTNIEQPSGITIDYLSERIYWTDSTLETIEYANYDGTWRTPLETQASGLLYPFALTVADDILFWTDWASGSIYATHKDHGADGDLGYFNEIAHFPASIPYGLEALVSDRQPAGINSCEYNNCSHVCLMTEAELGYTCACPEGYALETNGLDCKDLEGSGSGDTPPPEGSCIDGGYNETCCFIGYCAGYPPTCYCDLICYDRGDCCSDIDLICERVRPVVPTGVMAIGVTGSTAIITWTVPYVELTSEIYTVLYGLGGDALDFSVSLPGYSDITLLNATYTIPLTELDALTTYYYLVQSENSELSSRTEIMQFQTTEAAPSGPPQSFAVVKDVTSLTCSWDFPTEDDSNGVIVSFNLACMVDGATVVDMTLDSTVLSITVDLYELSTTYSCTVAASTAIGMGPPTTAISVTTDAVFPAVIVHPFIPSGVALGSVVVYLPESDDGTSEAIIPSINFPFGSSNRSSIYVGTNGLISFDSAYNSFFNDPFPEFVGNRYLVAPFWDDVDTRGGNGEVYYEVHESGHFLNQVNSFINTVRPSRFEGSYMLVVTWDAVHPYFGAFNPEENTFQAILITDGNYTYSIFTYYCGLLEWGTNATVGYNAAEDGFNNYDPSSLDIACLNAPLISNWSNVVYRLSTDSNEFDVPEQVMVSGITMNSATVTWTIPSLTEQQTYFVEYGSSPLDLTLTSESITSQTLLPNETYSVMLNGLDHGTAYYIRVVAMFIDITLYSTVETFTTIAMPPESAPQNFNVVTAGVSLTFSWDEPAGDNPIEYYVLACTVDGEEALRFPLQLVLEITIEELMPSTDYVCTIVAVNSGGAGPLSNAVTATTGTRRSQDLTLPFLTVGVTYGVEEQVLPETDDGTEGPIAIDPGLPFGNFTQYTFYVGTNGLLSFGSPYNGFSNQQFPGIVGSLYLVAPYWDDVDIRGGNGVISYEIHTGGYYLDLVNNFLRRTKPSSFMGTWMAVVTWDAVHPYFGASNPEENTFQAILITDGVYTYTIFVYKCGLLEWDNGVTIGFNAASGSYDNYEPSSSNISCLNIVNSNFTNVVYRLSDANPEYPLPQDVDYSNVLLESATVSWRIPSFLFQEEYYVEYGTNPLNLDQTTVPIQSPEDTTITDMAYSTQISGLEEGTIYFFQVAAVYDVVFKRYSELAAFRTKETEQILYLPFIEPTENNLASGTLAGCDDCTSSEISLPEGFPFGGYFHQSVYVSSNGLISFGRPVTSSSSQPFPTASADIFWSFIAAPFWSDVNILENGSVYWEVLGQGGSAATLSDVSNLIRSQYNEVQFSGTSMVVATWQDVVSPSLTMGNKFQAVLITDGAQSFAIFTYRCGYLEWSSPATIGINAPPDGYYNHPLTGTVVSPDEIACVHMLSELNNVIIDTEPNPVILTVTPAPISFIGSCAAAGYTDCCIFFEDDCFSTDCFCDDLCLIFGDCCYDYSDICPDPTSPAYDLLVANGDSLFFVHYEGADSSNLRFNSSQTVQGVDIHLNESTFFWSHSEGLSSSIHQASLNDATQEYTLVDTNLLVVADLAVDWVANNLYWVDSAWARIEVLGLYTMSRAEIIQTGANTNPTAIAVDPVSRFMFWTDFGQTAQIERAFLDGNDRRVLHDTDLLQPVGITVDYVDGRVYWSDVGLDRIEFSELDGSRRMAVETESTGLYHPFALTVADDILFWTDWETNTVYATHKEHGANDALGYFAVVATFASTPYGIEALLQSRQPTASNPCATANCSHICLLTGFNEQGYTCTCPDGYVLESDGLLCKARNGSESTPPPLGSCSAAGYTSCCTTGYCAGSPASCFCNPDCIALGSCCEDFDIICQEAPPEMPLLLDAININRTTVDITWVVQRYTYGTETYVVQYGLSLEALDMETDIVFSGLDTSVTYQQFMVKLQDLEPLTGYFYRVVATNILNSASSDVAMFSTINIGPPTNFEILVTGTETLTFRWDEPYAAGDLNIESYTLFCHPMFQDEISITVPTPDSITLEEDFLPGTTYTCSVFATNVDGDGVTAVQTATTLEGEGYLPFLVLGATSDVDRIYLPYEVDAASESVYLIGGLPTGDMVHIRAYVSTNGFISLDRPLLFWDASPFPTSEYYIINSYMFAPFWSDIDIASTGSVSYEVYIRGDTESQDAILDRVSGFVSTQTSSGFSGYMMMVAQWDAVHPFPHSLGPTGLSDEYIDYLQQENTFQALIITNGTSSYAVYTYNCNLMGWSGFNTYATIGYNLNGDYENHFLSGTSAANTVACLASPGSKWNNLLYAIDMSGVSEVQTQRALCIASVIEDSDIFGEVDDIFFSLESCPCSLGQAQVDPRFALYLSEDEFDCYIQLVPYGTSVQGCCYSTIDPTNGALITSGSDRGFMLLYSPLVYPNESLTYDILLRDQCCEGPGLCDLFFTRRPSDECSFYQPMNWAWGFGDPHFRNLDGATFTFNGQGEYTMLRVAESGFVLQGRTEPVMSGNNQASRFTAFAFGLPDLNIVIEVHVERGRMIAFYNQEDITAGLERENLVTNSAAITLVDTNTIRAVFATPTGTQAVSVTLDSSVEYLSYALNLDSYLTTYGLLGTFNGDTSDDFMYPDGSPLPPDASDEMIHEWGQAWQVTAQESLFYYGAGLSTGNYSNPDFVPSFKSDVVANAPDMITTYCGDNTECIFDYSVSGSEDVAAETILADQNYVSQENQASTYPPSINASGAFEVTVNVASSYNLTVVGGQLEVLGGLPENSELVEDGDNSGVYIFTWTLIAVTDTPITFIATDPMGGVAVHSPYITICACENGGECTIDGFLGTENNIFVLQCECPEAWAGRFCEEDLNGCSQIHCFQNQQCADIPAPGAGHVCPMCPSGFQQELEKCADIDECSRQDTNNCQHSCTNTFGGYECTCIEGYEPDPSDQTTCIDIDECDRRIDGCEQLCDNTDGSYTCSCNPGFSLNSDRMTCTQSGTECPDTNVCSDICILVGGTPVCSCSRGYQLGSDSATCEDVNECTDSTLCEQICHNTIGTFSCSCEDGYTINEDGRSCNDVDECLTGPVCPEGQQCENTAGNFTCVCPEGTMLNAEGECETIPVVEPTKVVVRPSTSVSYASSSSSTPGPVVTPKPNVKENSLLVTLPGYSVETFDDEKQLSFKLIVVEIILQCCSKGNSDQCQVVRAKREVVNINTENVFITDVKNSSDGKSVQFTLYVTTGDGGLLKADSVELCLKSGEDKLSDAGFSALTYEHIVSGTEGPDSGGLSDGAVAGIVIVVLFVVVAVAAVAAFILYRLRKRGKYNVSGLVLSDRSSEKKDLSALVMSTEEEGEL